MTQLSFGTNKSLRDEAYRLLTHNGNPKVRRFVLKGQILHGQYVGNIYYVDYDDRYALEDVDEQVLALSRRAEAEARLWYDRWWRR